MPWALYIHNIGYSPTLRTTFSNTLKYRSCGVINQKCWGCIESSFIVLPLLDHWPLDAQHGMFKLCMKNNSKATMGPLFDLNPLTCIWRTIHASCVLTYSFFKYLKLVEMAIVHVLGSIKDEHYFLFLAFQEKRAPRLPWNNYLISIH